VQLVPHAPQFELSLFRSTQPEDEVPGIWSPANPPPHCVRPVGQAHCPLVQATPPAQVVPHEPQLRLSVCVSTHAVVLLPNIVDVHAVPPSPHAIPASPPPSEPAHVPPEQTWLPPHLFPHPPQLPLSVCVLVHVEPQSVSPAPQTHIPPLHVAPCAHWFPQLPQLKLSV
jgi:hypothetical protein